MAPIAPAFSKHGTYVEDTPKTIKDYGSIPMVVAAMQRAGMSHAWIRIHGRDSYPAGDKKQIGDLIAALKAAKIAVAGWGWCQGDVIATNAKIALKEIASFGVDTYIADIEQDVSGAKWTTAEIIDFCKRIKDGFDGPFGMTSHGLIGWHSPELMTAAVPYVDMFNPQIYWFHYPDKKMQKQFKRPNGQPYGLNNTAEYTDLCLDSWRKAIGNSKIIVATAKSYWGEGDGETDADKKVEEFIAQWKGYSRITGLNWYSFGGSTSMSHRMLEAITAAKLDTKPFAK